MVASLFLIAVVGTSLYQSYDQRRLFITRERSPFYGIWEVEEFTLAQPPSTAPAPRWRRMIFDSPGRVVVQTETDPYERLGSQFDDGKQTITLRKRDDPGWNTVLNYKHEGPDVLTLTGVLDGSQMTARLRRGAEQKFLLTDRGFHWINEFPFNR